MAVVAEIFTVAVALVAAGYCWTWSVNVAVACAGRDSPAWTSGPPCKGPSPAGDPDAVSALQSGHHQRRRGLWAPRVDGPLLLGVTNGSTATPSSSWAALSDCACPFDCPFVHFPSGASVKFSEPNGCLKLVGVELSGGVTVNGKNAKLMIVGGAISGVKMEEGSGDFCLVGAASILGEISILGAGAVYLSKGSSRPPQAFVPSLLVFDSKSVCGNAPKGTLSGIKVVASVGGFQMVDTLADNSNIALLEVSGGAVSISGGDRKLLGLGQVTIEKLTNAPVSFMYISMNSDLKVLDIDDMSMTSSRVQMHGDMELKGVGDLTLHDVDGGYEDIKISLCGSLIITDSKNLGVHVTEASGTKADPTKRLVTMMNSVFTFLIITKVAGGAALSTITVSEMLEVGECIGKVSVDKSRLERMALFVGMKGGVTLDGNVGAATSLLTVKGCSGNVQMTGNAGFPYIELVDNGVTQLMRNRDMGLLKCSIGTGAMCGSPLQFGRVEGNCAKPPFELVPCI